MRTIVRIRFDGKDCPGGPEPLLRRAGCGPDVVTIINNVLWTLHAEVQLDSTDERVSVLIGLLLRHHIQWWERRENLYTEKEYDNAPLILIAKPCSREISAGPRYGTQYAMDNACKTCGIGHRQTSALMIDAKESRELKGLRANLTYYGDMLADDRLAEELASMNVKGLSFQDVYAVKKSGSRTKLPWKQMCAARVMPPMSNISTGIGYYKPCASCTRSSYQTPQEEPLRLAYLAKEVADLDEVMTSWECLGEGWLPGPLMEAYFPSPFFLVSPRVMRVIRAAEPNVLKFWPIRVAPSDFNP